VTFDSGNEQNGSGPVAGKAQESSAAQWPNSTSATPGYAEASAAASPKSNRDASRVSDAMADLHLSGSDPRMFPGILTRDQRSGSLRNLAQAEGWPVDSNEEPGDEDDE